MEKISFSGGAEIQPSETGKRGVYSFDGRSIPVTIQGVDKQGGVTFTRPDGRQYFQSGTRAVALNVLTAPIYSPKYLPARPSGPGNPPTAAPGIGFRNGNMNRGFRPPVGNEFRSGPGAGWVRKVGPTPPPPQSNVVQWMARGSNNLPASLAAADVITLIDQVVPQGYRLRLASFMTSIGPSAFWDDNLIWSLRIGDRNVFNPFGERTVFRNMYPTIPAFSGTDLITGRPSRNNDVVPFSMFGEDLEVVEAGTRIQLRVSLDQGWPDDIVPPDLIGGAIFGTLWGAK